MMTILILVKNWPLHAEIELNVSSQWILGNYSPYETPAPTFEEIFHRKTKAEGQVCRQKRNANGKVYFPFHLLLLVFLVFALFYYFSLRFVTFPPLLFCFHLLFFFAFISSAVLFCFVFLFSENIANNIIFFLS